MVAQRGVFQWTTSTTIRPAVDLAGYTSVGDWLDRYAGPFFETRSSLDWFIKRNRRELVEDGALIPREGRSGSLVSIEGFPKAVVESCGAELSSVPGLNSRASASRPSTRAKHIQRSIKK